MIKEQTDAGEIIQIPTHFSHYTYIKTIGAGASAVIVLVKDDILGVNFAAKIVSRAKLIENQRIEYFERELRLLQSMKHPHIISVQDVIYLQDIIVVMLEYCENGDLLTYITSQGSLNPFIARKMFYQLVTAVDYIHSKNIAHRDLKPENVFVDAESNIKLGDFGLSHDRNGNHLLSTLCGTLYYSAPEIINHQNYDGAKADIWSLGILLFCMINGTLPWTSSSLDEIGKEVGNGVITIPNEFPTYIEEIIHMCTKKNPDERATTAELLETNWLKQEELALQRRISSRRSFIVPSMSAKTFDIKLSTTIGTSRKKLALPAQAFLKQPIGKSKKRFSYSRASVAPKTFTPL